MSIESTRDDLMRRIKTLSERLWEDQCKAPDVDAWLANFDGRHYNDIEIERLHALHLLAHVSFFGLRELRVLLRAMYRDLFRYPIIQQLREDLGGTNDPVEIASRFDEELRTTRFVGMGNPAESGTHLLYYFRQENQLPRSLFVHQNDLLTTVVTDPDVDFVEPTLKRIVFIDDLCASGEQSIRYSRTLLPNLFQVASMRGRPIEVQYLVLFGTSEGIERAKRESSFHTVDAVSEMDSTYRTFGNESRVFRKPPDSIDKTTSEVIARGYGEELWSSDPLGYDNSQLLLAFHHNIPDNSLPILWFDEGIPPWSPAFPRFPKIG